MYQETEKFEKYGKLFVPLVAGVFLLPFVFALIVEIFSEKFSISSFLFVVVALMIVIVVPIMAMVLGNGFVITSLVEHTAKKVGELPYHFSDSCVGEANGSTLFIDAEGGMIGYISSYNPFHIQIFSASRVDNVRTVASPMTGIRFVFYLDGKKVSLYTAAIDGHVIYLNSDEGKKAVAEADKYVALLLQAKRAAEETRDWPY